MPKISILRILTSLAKTGLTDRIILSRGKPRLFRVSKHHFIEKVIINLSRNTMMETSENDLGLLAPPECVKGMKVLDKSKFKKYVMVPTLEVPCEHIQGITKSLVLRTTLMHIPGIAQIGDLDDSNPRRNQYKLLMLNPNQFSDVDDIDDEIRDEFIYAGRINLDSWKKYRIELDYDNWNHADILAAILPNDSQSVTGFSAIGHILHLNLKEHLMDYKSIIGEVLLDKISRARTVVNKTNTIDNTFRNFQLEVIAGEPDFITTAREHGFSYKMDFSKVYWNPRLSTEHQRIVQRMQSKDTVFDMFAGIGPFAIPACRKKCVVFASDLNPESYKWLNENVKLNKLKDPIQTYNMDGRDFAKEVIKPELLKLFTNETHNGTKVHIVMNLPALAIEFMDVFPGLLKQGSTIEPSKRHDISITVYCYCFCKEEDFHSDIKSRLRQSMGETLVPECEIRFVRNVAPSKNMYCVTLPLSQAFLFSDAVCKDAGGSAARETDDCSSEPPEKKNKMLTVDI